MFKPTKRQPSSKYTKNTCNKWANERIPTYEDIMDCLDPLVKSSHNVVHELTHQDGRCMPHYVE